MRLILAIAFVACLVLLAATAFMTPVSNDAGAYLTMAGSVLSGHVPYQQYFDHKGPGTYYLFAAILAATGRSLAAVQAAQWAGVVATAALAGWLGWRLWGRLAGALAALLALYGGAAYAGAHLTTEAWVGLLTAAALLWLLRRPGETPQRGDWLVAGALVGASALFKQTGLATLLAFGVWAWLAGGRFRAVAGRWLWLLAGCGLPLALAAGYFAARGALPDVWRDVVWVNLVDYAPERARALLRGNLVNLRTFPLLWLSLALALFLWPPRLRRSGQPQVATLLWLALLTGLLPLLHHSYGHYLLQALPSAAVLGGAGLAAGWQRLAGGPRLVRVAVAIFVVVLALIDLPAWPRYLVYTEGLVRQQQAAAAFIRAETAADEPILAVTAAPQFYFLSGRQPASRWLYLYPVDYTPAREAELAALIASRDVSTIVVDDSNPVPWHGRLRAAVESACTLRKSFGPNLHVFHCS